MRIAGWPTADYQRSWLRFDVLAGLGAGAVVIPQAMAYATIAEVPVEYGLYTCMVPMLVYAFLGGSRAMSVSTTSTVATLVASTLLTASIVAKSDDDPARDLITLVLLVGGLLMLARALHLGSLIENISAPVTVGVKIGVGLTVAAGQLPTLLGVVADPDADGFFEKIWDAVRQIPDADPTTVLLSAGSIATLLVLRRWAPLVPAPLVVVVGGILLVVLADLDQHGVALIAEIPVGLPTPGLPSVGNTLDLLPGAFAIALMVFLETTAVARAIRTRDEPAIDSDRELFAVGAASLAGSFFHSLPAAGGFSQSAVNQRAGARSQLSEVVTAALAVLVAVFLAGVLSDLPEASLAAMVVVATLGLVSIPEMGRLWRISRGEFWLAATTGAVGLTAGLLSAVAVGVALTLLWVLRELDHAHVVEIRRRDDGSWAAVDDETAAGSDLDVPGVLVLRVTAPLYTANVRASSDAITERCRQRRPAVVVVDARALGRLSVTVLDAVKELDRELAAEGTQLWVAELPAAALATVRRTHWWAQWEHEGRVHTSVTAAVDAASRREGQTPH